MQCVLVLDDEVMIGALLQEWLLEQGCTTVLLSGTVEEALRLIDVHPVEAAILDWTLKHETSAPVAEALKRRGIPFVFATGRDSGEVASLYDGAPVIPKPFEYEAVEAALGRLVRP